MYFCRNCNRCCSRCCQCRNNRPAAGKTEDVIQKPEPRAVFKTVSAGGITLSGFTGAEKEFDLICLDMGFPERKEAAAVLKFSCNLTLIRAKVDIRLQLMKSGEGPPVPVASPAAYRHTLEFSGSDTVFFTVHDPIPTQKGFRRYLVKLYITGDVPADGMAAVTNPVLIATIF